MMMMKTMKKMLFCLISLGVGFTLASHPASCVGRCGEVFLRGQQCACDYNCLAHNECCHDFDSLCITAHSCRGRCAEPFRRGQQCECDPECSRYNTCCPDYQLRCESEASDASIPLPQRTHQPLKYHQPPKASARGHTKWDRNRNRKSSNSESEEWQSGERQGQREPNLLYPLSDSSSGPIYYSTLTKPLPDGRPINSELCSDSPINGLTALINGTILIFKGELFWSVDPVSRLAGPPQSITDTLGVPSPIDTVFTRCNCQGHTYIIKGEQFWRLDSFLAVEPGYPKPLASEFSGLNGVISAALPLPATRGRLETIFFFKKGDMVQAYSFPTGGAPSCTKKPKPATYNRHFTRQHEGHLSREINLMVSLKGFPTPVSSALSLANPPSSHRYNHYLFSGPLFFTVQFVGGQLALANPRGSTAPPGPHSLTSAPTRPRAQSPAAVVTGSSSSQKPRAPRPAPPSNSIQAWLQCP